MAYVYSTLSCDNIYCSYKKGGGDIPTVESQVLIKGGSGIANKNIITPYGIATEVTPDELAQLESNEQFQLHKANGYIRVESKKSETEKVVKDMTKKDKSAPATPDDYTNSSVAPVVNKA